MISTGATVCCCPIATLTMATRSSILARAIRLLDWLGFYAQAENLTNNQHIAPIGYVSLPTSVRLGLKFQWGKEKPNVTPSAQR